MKQRYTLPPELVRFHIHIRRDHVTQLVSIADELAKLKGRDTHLGEALELALMSALKQGTEQLLEHAESDNDAPYWLALSRVVRSEGKAIIPARLSR